MFGRKKKQAEQSSVADCSNSSKTSGSRSIKSCSTKNCGKGNCSTRNTTRNCN